MISELVKGLRKLGNQWKHNDVAGFNLIFDAADTIETLSEKVRASNLHNGWIPVSEMLPERGKDVLVTRKYYGKDDGNKDDIYVEISACYADGEEWHGYSDEYKMNPRNHKVVAWMPLPEPYKAGDSE